jgi:SAM-dependent methyltransferase
MHSEFDYIQINRDTWNQRTEAHINSSFYDMPKFKQGRSSLNSIELELLGTIEGKSVLHLQCHFGQDSISLSRMGAYVTGIDLSDKAIDQARILAKELNVDTEFICCNIYDLPQHLNKTFDLVFTSYGTIGWLPDLDAWAKIVSQYLKPKGQFIFVEFHPVVWMFDDNFESIGYNYFNEKPIVETEQGTYADREADLTLKHITWNHPLSDVIGSLLKEHLEIKSFNEFDYSPYNCFNKTIEIAPNKFRITHLSNKIPMVYALVAERATK